MSNKHFSKFKTEYISGVLSFQLKPRTIGWLIAAVTSLGAYIGLLR